MPTIVLTASDVNRLISMDEVIRVVERALSDYATGAGAMPPKSYVRVERGDFRAMPATLPGSAGLKWVNVHPDNGARGLPTVMAVMVLNDPDTGYPLAVMDATELTAYRTGAAAAIASKYLARPGSSTLGLIGAGRQAHTQLAAHLELFRLQRVLAYDRKSAAIERLVASFPQVTVTAASLDEAAACDIVCTVTPAREPVLMKSMVRPGTHVNAIGADAEGKEELEPSILEESIVVVDDRVQATKAGEINVPVARGLFSPERIYATLGEIIAGRKKWNRDPSAITVFDSTGIAIEDIATARLLFDKAYGRPGYLSVPLVGS